MTVSALHRFAAPEWDGGDQGEAEVHLDAAGRVQSQSAPAQALIAHSPVLEMSGCRLVARDSFDQRRLERLLSAAAHGQAGELVLCDEAGKGVLIQAGATAGAVRLRLSSLRPPLGCADRFADLFGLTRAEARLAEAMLEGCDAGDCADRFGVSRTTIRSQLAALFDKTGRRRQATLLVLLAAVAATPPMAAARLEAPRVAANAA
jgi:DNA-binding CsgD family transcriptional regulator